MKHLSSRAPWARIFSLAVCALALAGCGGGGGGGGGGGSSLTGAGAGARSIVQGQSSPAAIAALSAPSGGTYRLTTTPPTVRANQAVTIQSSNSVPNTVRASAPIVDGALGDNFMISGGDYLSGTGGAVRTFQLGAARTSERSGLLSRNAGQVVTLSAAEDGRDGMLFTTVRAVSAPDPEAGEYLASSVWVYVPPPEPESESGLTGSTHEGGEPHPTWEVGALIDADDSFRTAASAIASADPTVEYVGEAGGLYVENDGGDVSGGSFTADVELEATFGSTDEICGELSNFRLNGNSYDATVTLGDAAITGGAGGRFNGALSATDDGNTFSGRWGGEFFGDNAELICGVFNASVSTADNPQTEDENELYRASFTGSFEARDASDAPAPPVTVPPGTVPPRPFDTDPGDPTASQFTGAIATTQATPTGGAGGVSQAVDRRVTATAVDAGGGNTRVTVNLPAEFGGALATVAASEFGEPGIAPFTHEVTFERENEFAQASFSNTDYTLVGTWDRHEVPNDETSPFTYGIYAHDSDTALTPVAFLQNPGATTLSYSGRSLLEYGYESVSGGDRESVFDTYFPAVSLTATFGSTNSIEGSMRWNPSNIGGGPISLELQDAPITFDAAGGFFTGNTRATQDVGGTSYTYSGRWGGQFYGTAADTVASTFGAATFNNPDNFRATVTGGFVADKQ